MAAAKKMSEQECADSEDKMTEQECALSPYEHSLLTQPAVAAEDCDKEDSILPKEELSNAAADNDDSRLSCRLPEGVVITPKQEELESRALSNEERLLAFADVYGRRTPTEQATHLQLEAFEREMTRLPIKKKSALHKGYTVKQARLFLDIENNDPKRAARRMATYWERRFELYGDEAFNDAYMSRRTREDYHRVYEMALRVVQQQDDADGVNKETRRWAIKFVCEWNRGHLECLDKELTKLSVREKAALLEAQKLRPDIVTSDEHRLPFLRCVDFDAKRASKRLAKYWELKLDLFGRENAFRSVTVEDLMKDHPRELMSEILWNIPGTDSFGRRIVLIVPERIFASLLPGQGCTEKGLLKVGWYILQSMLEEETKSCHHDNNEGLVYLIDGRYDYSLFKRKTGSRFASLVIDTFPMKVKAIHQFVPPRSLVLRLVSPFFKWAIGKRMRMRFWAHTGTEERTLSELEECGISRDMVPISLGGKVDIDIVGRDWLEERKNAGL